MIWNTTLVIALLIGAGVGCERPDAPSPSASHADAEGFVRQYLLEHPEFALDDPEIVAALRRVDRERQHQREAADRRAILAASSELLDSALTPWAGRRGASVTLIEFSDYQCLPCKETFPELEALKSSGADLRIVYAELPVYGSLSILAARAALAANRQGRFEALHRALMTNTVPPDPERIYAKAVEVGIDVEQLRTDMRDPAIHRHLDEVRELAEALGVASTPTFVIGDEMVRGFMTTAEFREAIARQWLAPPSALNPDED